MYNMSTIKKVVKGFAESVKEIILGMDAGEIKYNAEKYNDLTEMFDAVLELYKSLRYGDLSADEMELAYDIAAGEYDELIA